MFFNSVQCYQQLCSWDSLWSQYIDAEACSLQIVLTIWHHWKAHHFHSNCGLNQSFKSLSLYVCESMCGLQIKIGLITEQLPAIRSLPTLSSRKFSLTYINSPLLSITYLPCHNFQKPVKGVSVWSTCTAPVLTSDSSGTPLHLDSKYTCSSRLAGFRLFIVWTVMFYKTFNN